MQPESLLYPAARTHGWLTPVETRQQPESKPQPEPVSNLSTVHYSPLALPAIL